MPLFLLCFFQMTPRLSSPQTAMTLLDLGLQLFLGVHKNVGSSRLKDGPLDGSCPIFILTRLGLRSAMAKQS